MSFIKNIGMISKKFLNKIRQRIPISMVKIYGNVHAETSSINIAIILQIMET